MAFIKIKRTTRLEKRYSRKMGNISVKVTYIKKALLGIFPYKTLHKYRETYNGSVKDCEECVISA
ncbi:hypothetical protein [Robertkochia solimangrovi]|uniref:hypothetical protein n=1 Tax=Robertkochia solimangrovi TaxID=2213046 RepID=UPI0011816CC2|nr:hypothetical protein [Robertkochia solimangrovi]TRZ45756.1 hypothetical protein DMZ48_00305 [Robertkochia solimangrovi]